MSPQVINVNAITVPKLWSDVVAGGSTPQP